MMPRPRALASIAAATLVVGLSILPPHAAGASEEAALEETLRAFLAGASANDAAVHDSFWAEDLVYTSSAGERYGKSRIMASFDSSEAEAVPEDAPRPAAGAGPRYGAEDLSIRVLGGLAVVTFRLTADEAGERVGEYFNTGVFRKEAAGWRAFTWQATRIPGAAVDGS